MNDDGKVVVRWAEMMNRTIAGFMVYRFIDNDEPVMVGKASTGKSSFVDPSPVTGNKLNSYFVRALFIDGTESEPGEIAAIRIPW